ncbi:c-type cytochrome [Falsiruegeria mediterranea]|jgi:mono/diheme cytochrome c family protein|uniref:c-type cytochrome n=1 Tax=Falsiruegeria mediterranea TaxID=1280832 RepID=UPI0015F2506B|nr:cytochrome c [Falsiruegeria mediterranea]
MKAVLSLVLGLAAGATMAQDAEMGEALYLKHCATCHGIEATGQGPMAGVLVIKPVDLTQLEQDGIFPVERVAKRIDGRDALISHGSPMPVYGDFFEGRDVAIKTHTGQPLMTSQPIVDLIAYMRTLQAN